MLNVGEEHWSLKYWTKLFLGLAWLDEKRRVHPRWFSVASTPFTACFIYFVSSLVGVGHIANPSGWTFSVPLSVFVKAFGSLLAGTFLTQPLVKGLLPLLCYVRQVMSIKTFGLVEVSAGESDWERLTKKYACHHDKNDKVKVICISGRHLFREEHMPYGNETPLHALAKSGNLEVLMPVSNPANVTINARYATYSDDFRKDNGIDTKEKFVEREIIAGKEFLKTSNPRNELIEHDSLCMWRLVIFNDHCVVQNYFPNLTGTASYKAPTFVFQRKEGEFSAISYYNTFCKMYELIKSGPGAGTIPKGQPTGIPVSAIRAI